MNQKKHTLDGPGIDNGNYFGFSCKPEEARLALLSVPWDVTASYRGGAVYGPDAMIGASTQLDFYDPYYPDAPQHGIGTIDIDYSIQESSILLRNDAVKVISHLESGGSERDDYVRRKIERVNAGSVRLNEKVYAAASEWLERGKVVGVVGGDHSTPLGLVRALGEREGAFGVLHIDAHRDLRPGYEGFRYSHASIMYHVLEGVPQVGKLVQVAVRDWSHGEQEYAERSPRIVSFEDFMLAANRFEGVTWKAQCDRIIAELPQKVYVSFDIDGLSPENCPHTGTPVPGGLSFNEALCLIDAVVLSGRRIIGFDLCEVAPPQEQNDPWDANVGARMLYKLSNLAFKSNFAHR